jgi:hypothetical protein
MDGENDFTFVVGCTVFVSFRNVKMVKCIFEKKERKFIIHSTFSVVPKFNIMHIIFQNKKKV